MISRQAADGTVVLDLSNRRCRIYPFPHALSQPSTTKPSRSFIEFFPQAMMQEPASLCKSLHPWHRVLVHGLWSGRGAAALQSLSIRRRQPGPARRGARGRGGVHGWCHVPPAGQLRAGRRRPGRPLPGTPTPGPTRLISRLTHRRTVSKSALATVAGTQA